MIPLWRWQYKQVLYLEMLIPTPAKPFSHNSKRHSHLRVCSPHEEEVDLLRFGGFIGSFSKLLVLQQQIANKASWLLADPGTFKGTDVNFQSQSWLQFRISLQGVGNDSS